MTKELLTVLLLCATAVSFGCSNSVEKQPAAQSVVNVDDDDLEMAVAIETAKESFTFFEENWKAMKNDEYSVKFGLPTSDGEIEHIWFSPTKIQGDKVTGECANNPVKIPGLKVGDVRTVDRNVVSDWMIMVGRKCYGGYTIRVLAERDPDIAPPFEFVDPPVQF